MDEERKEEQKEVVPEWAKNLQESLSQLPQQIKEALTPEAPEEPEQQPLEIPVPQPQHQDPPPQPEEIDPQPEPEPEKPKKRNFLDWLL